ncbi:MAG: hypothetical protein AAGI01_04990 [Myxococcota bacterium]
MHPSTCTRALLFVLVCSGCSRAVGPSADDPADLGDDSARSAPITRADRQLLTGAPSIPSPDNMVEDPNFAMSTNSWFPLDGSNTPTRVSRAFFAGAPGDRPVVGLSPSATSPTCLLGRVKWSLSGAHEASVWIGLTEPPLSAGVEVQAFAVSLDRDPADMLAYPLTASAEGALDSDDGRSWTRYTARVPASFGWGFLQVCASADEPALVGAPTVVPSTSSASALLSPAARGRALTRAERARVRAAGGR